MKRLFPIGLLLAPVIAHAQPVQVPEPVALVCAFTTSPFTLTTSQFGYVQCNSQGQLNINPGGVTITAGLTPTSAITSGDLLYSSGGLIGDSGIPVGLSAFTSPVTFTGTTTPTIAVGQLVLNGLAGPFVLGANGEGWIGLSATNGLVIQGQGSVNDIMIANRTGGGCTLGTGSSTFNCGRFVPTSGTNVSNSFYLPAVNTPGVNAGGTAVQNWNTVGMSTFVPVFMANTPNAGSSSALCFTPTTSAVTYNSGVTTCLVSMASAKDITRPLTKKEGLDIVLAMTPDIYEYKKGFGSDGEQIGFVGEDVAKVDNRFVARDQHGNVSGVRYEQYTAALTAAIQAQQACLDSWKCRIFGWK